MTNVRLHISYDGTDYHGWQRQPGQKTVEGSLLRAVATLLDIDEDLVSLQGASRTDAGVHAQGQVANVIFEHDRTPWDFVRGLNAMTDDDISVNHAEIVRDDFNARFDARGKWYRYRIWNHRFPHPWYHRLHWALGPSLDITEMERSASHLIGEHDFSAFRASDCQASSTVRTIEKIVIEEHEKMIDVSVHGSAFLKNMVRIVVGSLVEVGLGQHDHKWLGDVLRGKDRTAAGRTAPASGLSLMQISYPNDPWSAPVGIGAWELVPGRET